MGQFFSHRDKAEQLQPVDVVGTGPSVAEEAHATRASSLPGGDVLVRREIRLMSEDEQIRFAKACNTMYLESEQGGTSVFSELAEIHARHCAHGKETFPGWHRVYLVEFERELQKADVQNGNDGKITLPYWDWTDAELMAKEPIPNVVEKHLSSIPAFTGMKIERGRNPANNLARSNLRQAVFDCLDSAEHWRHASTKWSGWNGGSLESPHNSVHVALGYPMGSVPVAGYDPIFWLHHCNVDRIYESYLAVESDSQKEFETFQKYQQEVGEENLFEAPLVPFRRPGGTHEYWTAPDTFDTKTFGYQYDRLMSPQPQQLTTVPTMAYFANIHTKQMNGKSYQVHVFVKKVGDDVEFSVPENVEDFSECDNYAGMGGIFGRGSDCENCEKRDPYQLFVPITEALERLGIDRHEAELDVVCVDTGSGNLKSCPLVDTNVPKPRILGPSFSQNQLEKNSSCQPSDVKALEKYLQAYGYMQEKSSENIEFDAQTEEAVKVFQSASDLKLDGIVGDHTKAQMLKPRCFSPDEDDFKRDVTGETFRSEEEVRYWVGVQPSTLKRAETLKEIQKAFDLWSEITDLKFVRVDKRENAKLKLTWTLEWMNEKAELFPFDGMGLTLARGIPHEGVMFDRAEVWRLYEHRDTKPAKAGEFYVLPVALHEIGHVLGLKHSKIMASVMSPFYKPNCVALTEHDKEAASEVYTKRSM